MKRLVRETRCVLQQAAALLFIACCCANAQQALKLAGDFWGTHDPSIMKEGKTWYVFATGKAPQGGQFAVRCSNDLRNWKALRSGIR